MRRFQPQGSQAFPDREDLLKGQPAWGFPPPFTHNVPPPDCAPICRTGDASLDGLQPAALDFRIGNEAFDAVLQEAGHETLHIFAGKPKHQLRLFALNVPLRTAVIREVLYLDD
jgi:hypothetical protein